MSSWPTLSREAEGDIAEAFQWYEDQRSGLGEEFADELGETMERISESPSAFQVVHREVRRALLRRFPYGVFYLTQNRQEYVLAVFHLARHPRRLAERAQR